MGHILRQVLEAHQYQVVMTRTDDSDVSHFVPEGTSRYRRDLKGRVRLVGRVRPITFISIHVNWHKDSWRRGAIVYYQEGEGKPPSGRGRPKGTQPHPGSQRQVRSGDCYVLRNTDIPAPC